MRPILSEGAGFWLLIGFGLTLLLLYASYRAVKWLFEPLHQIKVGTEKISRGELSYRIHHNRHDEIGNITQSVNQMAAELEKMIEAKRQLLLAISHELRTPLTRAKVGLEFVDNRKVKQSLAEDLGELEELVTELLEAEQLDQKHVVLHRAEVDLNALLSDVVGHHRDGKVGENPIELDAPDLPVVVRVDALRIKLLMNNLIGNALKYGGTQPIVVRLSRSGEDIVISVADQGDGIDEAHIAHLTEPFYRADSARQRQTGGYGLGLYLCRLIVEAHGGKLHIESVRQQGTTITVHLPFR